MCHSKTMNNKMKLHERALRLAYNYGQSTFEESLDKDNSFRIQHRNIQVLARRMYKLFLILPLLIFFKKRNI